MKQSFAMGNRMIIFKIGVSPFCVEMKIIFKITVNCKKKNRESFSEFSSTGNIWCWTVFLFRAFLEQARNGKNEKEKYILDAERIVKTQSIT